jgi:hypothetical protein
MQTAEKDESLKTLREIHSIMDRSARFISLSGWSGVWAGCVALVGAYIAHDWLIIQQHQYISDAQFVLLALAVLVVALIGGYFFTARKAKKNGHTIWNSASRQLLMNMAIPLTAGGIFSFALLLNGDVQYIAPAFLSFYGLALVFGGRFTLSEIRYLGYLELILGAANLFFPGYGLYFWIVGFGFLHILYGIFMWNKYDNRRAEE